MIFSGLVLFNMLLNWLSSKLRLRGGFNDKVLFSLFCFASADVCSTERVNDRKFDYLLFQNIVYHYCIENKTMGHHYH